MDPEWLASARKITLTAADLDHRCIRGETRSSIRPQLAQHSRREWPSRTARGSRSGQDFGTFALPYRASPTFQDQLEYNSLKFASHNSAAYLHLHTNRDHFERRSERTGLQTPGQ
jgi:hypothetical protein